MVGTKALGQYRLLRSLGRGSNAEVFLAQPVRAPETRVVVKRIFPHVVDHPKFDQMWDAEVRSMANFNHPYAVKFLEASRKDPGGPSLVMEYIPGTTLEDILTKSRRLSVERVGRLLGHLCHALSAAHETGIVHRDLKPANLMVVNAHTPDESIKVMDFGFAGFSAKPHIQLSELTGQGTIYAIGTPGYVSPEMIRGDTVDSRSDLYSVGVMLFELLSGRLPFVHTEEEKMLAAHVKDTPPRFHRIGCAFITLAVEGVVQLALSKYPNERPQSAKELLDAFGQAIGEPDLWEQTRPKNWDTMQQTATIHFTPPPQPVPRARQEPFHANFSFDAILPERMAAVKIKGFVEDFSGVVLDSNPGVVLMRLGVPKGYDRPNSKSGSSLFSWFNTLRKPTIPQGQEPIEVEMHLDKIDTTNSRLRISVTLRPMKEFMPKDPGVWQTRCDRLKVIIRQYLGG